MEAARKRTDPHRPSAIIPANYEHVCSYALATTEGGWPIPPLNIELVIELQSTRKFAQTGSLGKCSVCGARYIYGEVWVHVPTGEHIHIGYDCADKYEMLTDRSEFELQHNRHAAAAARECMKVARANDRADFLGAHPGLEEAMTTDHAIVKDIADRFMRVCELSGKQIDLVFKLAAEANAPKAEQEKLIAAPADGKRRVTFRGTVVSAKSVDSDYGTAYKMTVKVTTADGVWLAWGTVPNGLMEAMPLGGDGRLHMIRGAEVEVTATLHPGREPHFAIAKRPIAIVIKHSTQAQKEIDDRAQEGLEVLDAICEGKY